MDLWRDHELLYVTLELSGCYEQLELSAVAEMELMVKWVQLNEEGKVAGGAAAYEDAKFFIGCLRSGTLTAPSLGRHIASKQQKEITVVKERHKHAEECGFARAPSAKGGKTT